MRFSHTALFNENIEYGSNRFLGSKENSLAILYILWEYRSLLSLLDLYLLDVA